MRKPLSDAEQIQAQPFRMRGGDVLRMEGFSDTVFGFALTLLVVSLEVPRSYDEMMRAIRGFPAFAMCFYLFYLIWLRHYQFFRRYGLHDNTMLTLNGILLFVVLLYVYPLKFVFTLFMAGLTGNTNSGMRIEWHQVPSLFVLYGCGFAAIFGLFALFHVNALRQREILQLTDFETKWTRLQVMRESLMASVGIGSALLAEILPAKLAALSGFFYFMITFVEWGAGETSGKLLKAERSRQTPEATDITEEE